MANAIDDEARLRGALADQWDVLQTLVQGYVNEYYFKVPAKQATAEQWVTDSVKFTSDLAMLWLRGVGIGVKEGARLAAAAAKSAGGKDAGDEGADQPDGGGDFATALKALAEATRVLEALAAAPRG